MINMSMLYDIIESGIQIWLVIGLFWISIVYSDMKDDVNTK